MACGSTALSAYLSCQHTGIAEDHQAILCACERHIQAPWISQEANALRSAALSVPLQEAHRVCCAAQGSMLFLSAHLVLIGAHAGQDDEVLLTSLESVHTGHLCAHQAEQSAVI